MITGEDIADALAGAAGRLAKYDRLRSVRGQPRTIGEAIKAGARKSPVYRGEKMTPSRFLVAHRIDDRMGRPVPRRGALSIGPTALAGRPRPPAPAAELAQDGCHYLLRLVVDWLVLHKVKVDLAEALAARPGQQPLLKLFDDVVRKVAGGSLEEVLGWAFMEVGWEDWDYLSVQVPVPYYEDLEDAAPLVELLHLAVEVMHRRARQFANGLPEAACEFTPEAIGVTAIQRATERLLWRGDLTGFSEPMRTALAAAKEWDAALAVWDPSEAEIQEISTAKQLDWALNLWRDCADMMAKVWPVLDACRENPEAFWTDFIGRIHAKIKANPKLAQEQAQTRVRVRA